MTKLRSTIPVDKALLDAHLLGKGLGDPHSWSRWLSVLRAAFARPLSAADLAAFKEVSGNREPPPSRVSELWCTIGRRSGKSRIAAALACYVATCVPHRMAGGETGTVMILAASQSQATVVFQYCLGFLNASPILKGEIESVTASQIRLHNGIVIAVHANSFKTVRGRTLLACIFDEVALWRDVDSALPDLETYRAVLPALMTTHGMLIGISSPYRKTGLLFTKHRDFFATDDPRVLVVQGAIRQFNPTLDAEMIATASQADPEAAIAEWEGEFRTDISGYLDDETIEACTDYNRPLELPPLFGKQYVAFTDASGGRHDAFTLAIAHKEGTEPPFYVCDVIRGRQPPFDPEAVVAEYAALCKAYGISSITGDAYGAVWVESTFRKAGLTYKRSELNRLELYLEALPHFMRKAIALPDHQRLIRELRLLERRTSRMGRDIIDHGKRGSDDYSNCLVGALHACSAYTNTYNLDALADWNVISEDKDGQPPTEWRNSCLI